MLHLLNLVLNNQLLRSISIFVYTLKYLKKNVTRRCTEWATVATIGLLGKWARWERTMVSFYEVQGKAVETHYSRLKASSARCMYNRVCLSSLPIDFRSTGEH